MSRLVVRLGLEALLAGLALLFGVLFVGYREAVPFAASVPVWLGWVLIGVSVLLFAHISITAAFGKVRTPPDAGAGFRVPGTPRPTRHEEDTRDPGQ